MGKGKQAVTRTDRQDRERPVNRAMMTRRQWDRIGSGPGPEHPMSTGRFDRQDRERARVLLLGLLCLALLIAYHVVPVLLWGPER